ncbi:AI-2E family transporter [Methylobacterium gnaphalii]|uniref:AI-2E family transporter n=1 Tax=Methylobacterium gnaphalii TaxID=1010610 RepID=A0A512JED7_9HYPH|nr:AI-2E family transporter [Methylobacterium gnaphalii]GEP08314.1 AI-2E family transporter [Methylobacterium gnaphalii]GJD67912.1 Putative transport protein YdiK [Methylobacterium gnaphalii]GLS51055.1 AI-2E family transporter [Methylobacterium gnaphalii]
MHSDEQSGTHAFTAREDDRAQVAARIALAAALVGLGLYILSDFLRALVWAVVLAIALWPLYVKAERRFPPGRHNILWPSLFTAVVALAFLIPVVLLAVEAVGEARELLGYAKAAEESGIPVPAIVAKLPFGAPQVTDWWNANLAHAGWAKEMLGHVNTASNREVTKTVGANLAHRVVLFGFALLTLFFLFRDGRTVVAQSLTASHRLFGPRGERVARQMVASVHGTVDGLVLVGIGEGILLGIVYWFAGVPHPILFGAVTAVAAMIPFGAPVAFGLAALLLVGNGSVVPALVVAAAGLVVTFVADHFVRPALIGGTTRLPFVWVLLGILGGVETFGLLGLFVGPAVMAALILLWREFTEARPAETQALP